MSLDKGLDTARYLDCSAKLAPAQNTASIVVLQEALCISLDGVVECRGVTVMGNVMLCVMELSIVTCSG